MKSYFTCTGMAHTMMSLIFLFVDQFPISETLSPYSQLEALKKDSAWEFLNSSNEILSRQQQSL